MDFFINDDPADMTHGAIALPGQCLSKHVVMAVTIDSFCAEHNVQPDVIKVDVEGFEPCVIEGARRLIGQHRPMVWFVELHP